MRIEELHLIAFGPFTNRKLDFSNQGLHVIFGPNEAGKSSALRGIDSLLFGIPMRSGDTFLHRKDDLRIGARLSNRSGQCVTFARRKGKLKSLVSLDGQETFLASDLLDNYLLGMEQQRFRDIYCINHPELRAGGELMRELKGLAGESLLVASTSSDLPRIENQLQEEIDSLFVARGRKNKIKQGITDYQTAKKDKSEYEVRVSQWTKLQSSLDEQERTKSNLRETTRKLRANQSRLERLRDALPKIAEWKRVNEELSGQDVQILPEHYSVQQRQQCQTELRSIEARIAELHDEIALNRDKLAQTSESPLLLAEASAIEALQQRIGTQVKAQEERKRATDEVAISKREIERLLKEMDAEIAFDQVHQLRLRKEHRAALFELAENERTVREKPLALANEREEYEQEIERLRKQAEQFGAEVDTRPLERVLHEVAQLGDIENELDSLREEHSVLSQKTETGLAALPDWSGSLEELLTAKLPLRETIDRHAQVMIRLTEKRDATQDRLQDVRRDRERLLQEIEAAKKTSAVVTEDDLRCARETRDQLWRQIENAIVSPSPNRDETMEWTGQYTQDVARADEIADRLRREADRVAELAQRESQVQSLEKQISDFTKKLDELHEQEASHQREWKLLWKAGGVATPKSAKEMAAWLQLKDELTSAAEDLQLLRRRVAKLDQSIANAKRRLSEALQTLPVKTLPNAESFRELAAVADEFIQRERARKASREQLQKDLQRLAAAIEIAQRDENTAKRSLSQWQDDWSTAMSWIACTPQTTSALARARVECLDDLSQRHEQWLRLSQRINSIDEDEQSFSRELATIAARAEIDIAGWAPVDMARRLKSLLDEAKQEEQTASGLRAAITTAEEKIYELRSAEKQNAAKIAQFFTLAGAESNEGLARIETQSDRAVTRRELRDEILRISGGGDFDEFVAAAADTDIDELTARLTQLEEEIQEKVDQTDLVVARITEITREMDAIDGNAASAEADQRGMTCLANVHALTRRYAKLKIAQSLLRQHIERYQEENRDPLLAKASDYFATMTCNEFLGLQVDYDDNNRPIIHGVRSNRQLVDVAAMSDGTRDPMFLALRLAYIQKRLGQYEPMPFIVDDILIHLDDDRATATLQVLAGLAEEMQVLFFTHHDRLRDLAENNLPTNHLTVHELEKNTVASLSSPRHPK